MLPDIDAEVTVEARVSPSEDLELVAVAVKNVVGDHPGQMTKGDSKVRYVSGELGSLLRLRDQLRDRRVRAVGRRLLSDARQGPRTELMLNRQAAVSGVLVLCGSEGESPLGPVYVTIESRKLEELITWLTA